MTPSDVQVNRHTSNLAPWRRHAIQTDMASETDMLLARLDAALHRIELAQTQISDLSPPDMVPLARHQTLRAAAQNAVTVLETLIESGQPHG